MIRSAMTGLLALTGAALVSAAPKVTLDAPGHSPQINKHWDYSLSVSIDGKPATARLTEAIVDPIGGVHPVQFGKSTKNITRWPFSGSFHDFIIWPATSRGIPLTFRVTVQVGAVRKVVNYPVTPHA